MNLPQYRLDISNEIAARTASYQQTIAQAKQNGVLGQPNSPLNLLADGDSWFDYPLGPIPFVTYTDIIEQLPGLCAKRPYILKLAHYGDATTTELGLQRTQKIINAINDPANGPFDAILFSGGGNDVVGDPFCIWLNDASDVGNNPAFALDSVRFGAILGVIQASYLDLISLRNDNLPNAPIFVHAYDWAIPTGIGACPTVGPWLKPALDYCGWTNPIMAAQIVKDALTRLAQMLASLAADPKNNLFLVPTQGTLAANQWANELHPIPDGFKLMATKFKNSIAAYPPFNGRI